MLSYCAGHGWQRVRALTLSARPPFARSGRCSRCWTVWSRCRESHPHPSACPSPTADTGCARAWPGVDAVRGAGRRGAAAARPTRALPHVRHRPLTQGVRAPDQDRTLFAVLDDVEPLPRDPLAPFRMSVIDRYKDMGTIAMGKSEAGLVRKGDRLFVMPNKCALGLCLQCLA